MRKLKRFAIVVLSILALGAFSIYALGYWGERQFDAGTILPAPSEVVAAARKISGAPYDPLMGMYGNIGSRFGFVVCSDVPNIAYGLAGFSWKKALAEDFFRNPFAYESAGGNNPNNPYFHRRARNLYAWFHSKGKLKSVLYKPAIGDLVFYKKRGQRSISHVALVISSGSDGYTLMESAPKTIIAQEVDDKSPIERGWVLAGFGKVY